jgi:hypothetical protein
VAQRGLGDNARERHHGEAAVLELVDLELSHIVLAEAKGVEGEVACD